MLPFYMSDFFTTVHLLKYSCKQFMFFIWFKQLRLDQIQISKQKKEVKSEFCHKVHKSLINLKNWLLFRNNFK